MLRIKGGVTGVRGRYTRERYGSVFGGAPGVECYIVTSLFGHA